MTDRVIGLKKFDAAEIWSFPEGNRRVYEFWVPKNDLALAKEDFFNGQRQCQCRQCTFVQLREHFSSQRPNERGRLLFLNEVRVVECLFFDFACKRRFSNWHTELSFFPLFFAFISSRPLLNNGDIPSCAQPLSLSAPSTYRLHSAPWTLTLHTFVCCDEYRTYSINDAWNIPTDQRSTFWKVAPPARSDLRMDPFRGWQGEHFVGYFFVFFELSGHEVHCWYKWLWQ